MSETGAKETAILLPTASVDIFVRDKQTVDAARALVDDWRFARVTVNIEEGDVETAIAIYRQTESPALIIIETDTTDDSFARRLEELSDYCREGTSAMVIGPVNDVNLYRKLVSMGISDYLVRPVPLETLSEAIASSLIKQLGTTGSRLIAMIGTKGGVGTTTLAEILSFGIANHLGQKTFLMDAAGGWSSLAVGMGFEPSTTLQEAVRAASNSDEAGLKRMVHIVNDKLSVLASGMEQMLDASVQAQQYEELLDTIMKSYPVVLVDLSAAIPALKRTVINRAHEMIMVSTPTLSSLRAARSLIQEIKEVRGGTTEGMDLVLNMQGFAPTKEVSKTEVEAALNRKISVTIPFDSKLFIGAESELKKFATDKTGMQILQMLMPLAERVAAVEEESAPEADAGKGLLGRVLGKLK